MSNNQKTFQGKVIESKDNSFLDKKTGETIVGWGLVLMLTDDIQKRFFISDRNVCYREAKEIVKGNVARVHADAQPGFGDQVKWVPVQIENILEDGQPGPKF